jgi:divalent metal cation (Fe/Co/Zn/Cd) transporter
MNRVFQGLITLNGGGAVALLAFLQAIWRNNRDDTLVYYVLWGIVWFAIGLALAVLYQIFRYHTSMAHQKGSAAYRPFQWMYRTFMYTSLVCFGVAIGTLVLGAFTSLDQN